MAGSHNLIAIPRIYFNDTGRKCVRFLVVQVSNVQLLATRLEASTSFSYSAEGYLFVDKFSAYIKYFSTIQYFSTINAFFINFVQMNTVNVIYQLTRFNVAPLK